MTSVFRSEPLAACPSPFNMAEYVLAAGLKTPEKTALELCNLSEVQRFTYADIRGQVLNAAGVLRANGVCPEHRVLMRLGNELSFPITYLAALWLGAVPVPTSAQLTTPEITKIAAQLRPDLIVAGDGIDLPRETACPVLASTDLFEDSNARLPEPHRGDPNRLGYIIFTSGTTEGPRGVMHAHRAIWARQMMFDAWYGLTPDDRLLHAGAFNWTYTLGTGLMDPWTLGATAIIPTPDVESSDLFALLKRSEASIFAAAPGVYRQMLKSGQSTDLPALRHGLSAGEKLPPALISLWRERTGRDVHEALGMSECSTYISGSPSHPAHDESAGWPQPGRCVAVLGPDLTPVERGQPGVLCVAKTDPGLCLGYLDAPLPDGDWFSTGDTVTMEPDGAITYLGRNDDMLNAGGFRVSPVEVEAAFAGFDNLTECAAIALSPKANTKVIALIYSAPAPLDETRLRAHAQSLLARYKQPRLYIHHPLLPKGANGKLNRKSLRAQIEADNGET